MHYSTHEACVSVWWYRSSSWDIFGDLVIIWNESAPTSYLHVLQFLQKSLFIKLSSCEEVLCQIFRSQRESPRLKMPFVILFSIPPRLCFSLNHVRKVRTEWKDDPIQSLALRPYFCNFLTETSAICKTNQQKTTEISLCQNSAVHSWICQKRSPSSRRYASCWCRNVFVTCCMCLTCEQVLFYMQTRGD